MPYHTDCKISRPFKENKTLSVFVEQNEPISSEPRHRLSVVLLGMDRKPEENSFSFFRHSKTGDASFMVLNLQGTYIFT